VHQTRYHKILGLLALDTVRHTLETYDNVDEFFFKYLTKIENIFTKKQKQSTIQDFFAKDK
jgi:hypothetical protein